MLAGVRAVRATASSCFLYEASGEKSSATEPM